MRGTIQKHGSESWRIKACVGRDASGRASAAMSLNELLDRWLDAVREFGSLRRAELIPGDARLIAGAEGTLDDQV